MNKTYLITGGTGFLGTLLSAELLKRGERVIFLSRSKNQESAKNRIAKQLDLVDNLQLGNIETIETDFQKKFLGIDSSIMNNLVNKIDAIWHLAANLSFREKDRKEVFDTNVEGLKRILELASEINSPVFYISTAYVHGQQPGLILENDLIKPKKFNNPYEESKFEAEKTVKEWGAAGGGKFIIFRPSILIERHYQFAGSFGYYKLLETIYKMKEKMGNKMFFPFPYSKCRLNLIPVDTAIKWMLSISENPRALGQTFHITNPNPFPIKIVAQQSLQAINLRFIVFPLPKRAIYLYFYFLDFLGLFIKSVKYLAKNFSYYLYYMIENNSYDMENVKKIVKSDEFDNQFNFPPNFIYNIASEFTEKIKK